MNTGTLESLVVRRPQVPDPAGPAVVLVDKPKGPTSFDVVWAIRRRVEARKVGHAGTLDPMATGLLIVLVGRGATKRQRDFMGLDKIYEGTLRLGETTPSYDAETEVARRRPAGDVTDAMLNTARQPFLGAITQHPPLYSAVKVGGERLYKKARRGETARRPPRQVRVDAFEVTGRDGPDVSFRVECSKGTYIRSLAHDFGKTLGVGAHLVRLCRTAIGPYAVEDAWPLDELEETLE